MILYKLLPFFLSFACLPLAFAHEDCSLSQQPVDVTYTSGTGETVDLNGNNLAASNRTGQGDRATLLVITAGSLPANPLNDRENPRYRSDVETRVVPLKGGPGGVAETVQPKLSTGTACPQSVAGPAALSKPKIPESMADLYARIVEEEGPWYEPKSLVLP